MPIILRPSKIKIIKMDYYINLETYLKDKFQIAFATINPLVQAF